MTRQGVNTVPMLVTIDREPGAAPLHRQIYRALRAAILEGGLAAGSRLPGSRVLADDLGVSRSTILTAFDQLTAEGYIVGKSGGGTRVGTDVPRVPTPRLGRGGRSAPSGPARLSLLGGQMIAAYGDFPPHARSDHPVPFAIGGPGTGRIPGSYLGPAHRAPVARDTANNACR